TLYASDWRYDDLASAFDEMVAADLKGDGVDGFVIADVLDPGLQDALAMKKNSSNPLENGKQLQLKFDLDQWKTAAFGGPRVNTLVRGKYKKMMFPKDRQGVLTEAPLLVKFTFGKGTVIFTSFHN